MKIFGDAKKTDTAGKAVPAALVILLLLFLAPPALVVIGWMIWIMVWWFC